MELIALCAAALIAFVQPIFVPSAAEMKLRHDHPATRGNNYPISVIGTKASPVLTRAQITNIRNGAKAVPRCEWWQLRFAFAHQDGFPRPAFIVVYQDAGEGYSAFTTIGGVAFNPSDNSTFAAMNEPTPIAVVSPCKGSR